MSYVHEEHATMAQRIPTSSIRHRKEFNLASKDVDETMENWYNRLKQLAEQCEYGSHSEAFILHQFICGLDVLLLEHLRVEERDLSLSDVFDLTKKFEYSNVEVDVKPVLLSIKHEELPESDGEEQYNDNTFNDYDSEEHEDIHEATTEDSHKENEASRVAKTEIDISPMMPFTVETVTEPQISTNMFECYLCHKSWKTAGHLTYHFTCYHTIGKTSKCHLCGKWISDASNMVRHLNMHLQTKLHRCDRCDISFARPHSLKNHLLSHGETSAKSFHCSKCSKIFISKKHLKLHRHREPIAMLSEKMDELIMKRKDKAKTEGTGGKFKCDICSTEFVKEAALNVHMKVHCETEWLCHLCGKKLMNKRNLIHHYRVHTNEKPFSCDDCGRTFSSKEKLKLHSKSHSDIRPHRCTLCDKSFIQKGHVVKHMKVHFPDKKFKCHRCPKEFLSEEKLNRHVLTHSGPQLLLCSYCQKGFKSKSHLTEHERTHTGEKPYNCTLCTKSFGQRATLRGHLKWHAKPKVERPKKKRKQKIDTSIGSIGHTLVQATSAYLG